MQKVEKETRNIFHNIHTAQGENVYIFERLAGLLNTKYLGVDDTYFQGKICLDAGCGSNANATYSMLEMGAKKAYAFDLDETVYENVPKYLKKYEGQYELSVNNLLDLTYQDNFFDFVHCSGVLHHTVDVYQACQELARVTKIGGYLYFYVNGTGGFIRDTTTFLRNYYRDNEAFKNWVDGLEPEDLIEFFKWTITIMKENGDVFGENFSVSQVRELFDEDLILTLKDRVMAPLYHEISENEITNWLKNHGFTQIRRLTRYPKYKNVRRFFSPLYFKYDHKFSKLLYGSGNMQLIAVKSK